MYTFRVHHNIIVLAFDTSQSICGDHECTMDIDCWIVAKLYAKSRSLVFTLMSNYRIVAFPYANQEALFPH